MSSLYQCISMLPISFSGNASTTTECQRFHAPSVDSLGDNSIATTLLDNNAPLPHRWIHVVASHLPVHFNQLSSPPPPCMHPLGGISTLYHSFYISRSASFFRHWISMASYLTLVARFPIPHQRTSIRHLLHLWMPNIHITSVKSLGRGWRPSQQSDTIAARWMDQQCDIFKLNKDTTTVRSNEPTR